MRAPGTLVVLIGIALSVSAWAFRGPTSYALDRECEPRGPWVEVRARVQGRTFWRGQLVAVDSEMQRLAELPLKMRYAALKAQAASVRVRWVLDSLGLSMPSLRRPPYQVNADSLRVIADAIERDGRQDAVDSATLSRYWELASCRESVVANGEERPRMPR